MTWTMDCKECKKCKGSRKKVIHRMFKPPSNKCPTCSGKGGWWLGVECENSESGGCRYAENGTCSCKNGYRPLTVEEVAKLAEQEHQGCSFESIDDMIYQLGDFPNLPIMHKGQPIKLIPREG